MPRSQFQDTFTKNEGDKNLQYDDSAFYFFASAILICLVIWVLISIYNQMKSKWNISIEHTKICDCKFCENKTKQMIKFRKYQNSFYLKILFMLFLSWATYNVVLNASTSKGFKSFDPFEILEIDHGSSMEIIKRQYKKLAIKLHPDVNKAEDAEQKFILLNKAYTCLTKPETSTNCGDYGKGEGSSGSFEVGIALPSFLMRKKNRFVILSLFFLFILIILPLGVFYFYQNSESVDRNGINMAFYGKALEVFRNENIIFKNFIEIMVQAEEMIPFLSAKPNQIKDLEKLRDPDFQPKVGELKFRAYLKLFYLLHAYMTKNEVPASLEQDLAEVLKICCKLLDSLLDFSMELYTKKQLAQYMLGKELNLGIVERIVLFSQHFYQGLWLHDSSLLQLPSFSKSNFDRLKRKLKKCLCLNELRKIENPKEFLEKVFESEVESKIEEDMKALKTISNLKLSCCAFVENSPNKENEVFVGDLFTIKISIHRLNEHQGFIHSKVFPFLKRETLILMISDNVSKTTIDYKKIISDESVVVTEWKDFARSPVSYNFKVSVKSDSYLHAEDVTDFTLTINPRVEVEKELIELHPDDEKALKEIPFMTSLLNEANEADKNSDDELEDEPFQKEEEEKEVDQRDEIKEEKDHSN